AVQERRGEDADQPVGVPASDAVCQVGCARRQVVEDLDRPHDAQDREHGQQRSQGAREQRGQPALGGLERRPRIVAHALSQSTSPYHGTQKAPQARIKNPLPAGGRGPREEGYSPFHWGARFSAKAAAPSMASLDANTGWMISPCLRNISSSDQSCDSMITRLVAASASGALAAILRASSIAPSSALPGSVIRLTRPSSYRREAG